MMRLFVSLAYVVSVAVGHHFVVTWRPKSGETRHTLEQTCNTMAHAAWSVCGKARRSADHSYVIESHLHVFELEPRSVETDGHATAKCSLFFRANSHCRRRIRSYLASHGHTLEGVGHGQQSDTDSDRTPSFRLADSAITHAKNKDDPARQFRSHWFKHADDADRNIAVSRVVERTHAPERGGDIVLQMGDDFQARVAYSWAVDRLDSRGGTNGVACSSPTNNGQQSVVYVIDSGINSNHNELRNSNVSPGLDTIGPGGATSLEDDCSGHGTAVAGMISGDTTGVARFIHEIVSVKVFGCSGTANTADIEEALMWIHTDSQTRCGGSGPGSSRLTCIVNMSFGAHSPGGWYSSLLTGLFGPGSHLVGVASAGNDASDACFSAPANHPDVIAVAGSTVQDFLYDDTNFGECCEFIAPAVDVPAPDAATTTSLRFVTGTSFAAPLTCATIAILAPQSGCDLHDTNCVKAFTIERATVNEIRGPLKGIPNRVPYYLVANQEPICESIVASAARAGFLLTVAAVCLHLFV